jgi:hypothetical protein
VHEDLRLRREVVVDDVVDMGHIHTPSSNVGDDKYTGQSHPKVLDLLFASCLVKVAIHF